MLRLEIGSRWRGFPSEPLPGLWAEQAATATRERRLSPAFPREYSSRERWESWGQQARK